MGTHGGNLGTSKIPWMVCRYPLVDIQKTIENCHVWWIYPLKMVDLSIVMGQFTRGYVCWFINADNCGITLQLHWV